MSAERQRTCPSCGNELSGAADFCPVCILRKALAGGVESGESSFEEAVKPVPTAQRLEHYELVRGADGKPVELGRGAMGVTYKAFDIDLHCPVTLVHQPQRTIDSWQTNGRKICLQNGRGAVRQPASPDNRHEQESQHCGDPFSLAGASVPQGAPERAIGCLALEQHPRARDVPGRDHLQLQRQSDPLTGAAAAADASSAGRAGSGEDATA